MLPRRINLLHNLVTPYDRHEMKALKILLEYLSEVDHCDLASAAITNGLEAIFEKTRGPLRRGSPFDMATFVALGKTLSPSVLGCSLRIFKQMESFFLRRSEDLFASGEGLLCIQILDELSLNGRTVERGQWDMLPALSCLVQKWDTIRDSRFGSRNLPPLTRKSREIFEILRMQSRDRYSHPHRIALPHRHRPPMLHRPHSHHGGFAPLPSRPKSGTEMCRHELLDLWKNCPETIIVDPLGSGLDGFHDYDDGFYDHEQWPLSDEEDLGFETWSPRHMLEHHAYGPHDDIYLQDLRRGHRRGLGRALPHPHAAHAYL